RRISKHEHADKGVLCDYVFFFQAEDGIRDRTVTGVQTCALPICSGRKPGRRSATTLNTSRIVGPEYCLGGAAARLGSGARGAGRSEERRVGKECRSRGGPEA